jgi:Flp pilus assembly pilin Flp
MNHLKRFFDDEAGNATEYVLIVALTSLAIMAGATLLGSGLNELYANVIKLLPSPWT